ncbi:hypothetical protein B0H11DRAFT_363998 [Mycena galericulata]|nr:hypothetical protein B0H11DRAFT_363998 [Mycena galericulata]
MELHTRTNSKYLTLIPAFLSSQYPVNMSLTLLKIPLILTDILCMRITATPPNPPFAPGEHTVFIPDWRERFLRGLAWPCVFLRAVSYSLDFLQIFLIIGSHNPTTPIFQHIILRVCPASSTRLTTTPSFAFGSGITLVGTLLRVQCYRTLGRHFTFQLSIQKDHKLVTRGPYSVVRHPSYTALIMTLVGGWMTLALQGSYFWECGMSESVFGRTIVRLWVAVALAVVTSLVLRLSGEDEMLKKKFGTEWDEWQKVVPWKIVPWIL